MYHLFHTSFCPLCCTKVQSSNESYSLFLIYDHQQVIKKRLIHCGHVVQAVSDVKLTSVEILNQCLVTSGWCL